MEDCGIYIFQNVVNGKAYIGKSKELHYRYEQHIRLLRKNNDPCVKLNRAWQKYGEENFVYGVLCYCDPSQLDDMERLYIAAYDSRKNGYNCTDGGGGILGYSHSEETKGIIRAASTGRKHTEESKKRMSEVQRGRIVTEEHRAAMRRAWTPERKRWITENRSGENNPNYNKVGKDACRRSAVVSSTGEFFPTLVEAAKWCGLKTIGNLSSCSTGRRKYCGRHPETGEQLSWRKATEDEIAANIA